jgi:hypothetical protein
MWVMDRMITKAHHPTSLTEEEDDAPRRHKDTENAEKKGNFLPALCVSVSLWLPAAPQINPAQCPQMSPNVPFYRIHLDRTCQRAPRRTMPSRQCETNPPPRRSLAHLASWRFRLPVPSRKNCKTKPSPPAQTRHNPPKPATTPGLQNKPTKPDPGVKIHDSTTQPRKTNPPFTPPSIPIPPRAPRRASPDPPAALAPPGSGRAAC